MNERFATIVRDHPTRFGAFAVLPMDDMDAALDEMTYALDVLGLDGIAATTNVQGVYLGDPRFHDLLAELDRRAATLFVHPTVPPDFDPARLGLNVAILEFMFESTRMATHMVVSGAKAKFPRANIICTHGGGATPYLAPRIGILEPIFGAGPGRPVLAREEIAAGLASFHYDLTATRAAQLDGLRRLVPPERLLMGTDYPMMPDTEIAPAMQAFSAYEGFGEAERQLIVRTNALALFPRLQTALAAA
jgi:predicted TIM-barrel fold metal-dependent hydrolase